jgi:hypothetical protein
MSKHEPPPQNELERLIREAAHDPALEGKMWQMIWESELYAFVPDHPEMHGEHPLRNGDQFVFSTYPHPLGEFISVFTSEAAADWAGAQIPKPKPAIASMPAEALFKTANDGKTWVRVNHGLSTTAALDPYQVPELVGGHGFIQTNSRENEALTLVAALPSEFPAEFLKAVRRFCDERRAALGVYPFYAASATSSTVYFEDVRLLVCLRAAEPGFLEDFQAEVNAVTPEWQRVTCTGATADRADIIESLQGRTPLWPVVEE